MSMPHPIEAQFIETPEGQVFTVFNVPRGVVVRSTAVLLLCPCEQEYKRVHWAYRALANSLSRNGWPVLRFDYNGTGDSSGATGSADLDIWVNNATDAASYLRQRTHVLDLHIVGVRLGAIIANRVAAKVGALSAILWDPINDGQAFLGELEKMELAQRKYDRFKMVDVSASPGGTDEFLLGFPMSAAFRDQLIRIKLADEALGALYTHVIRTSGSSGDNESSLAGSLSHFVDEKNSWGDFVLTQDALMAPRTIKEIIRLIGAPAYE